MISRLLLLTLCVAPLGLLAAGTGVVGPAHAGPAASIDGSVKIGDRKISLKQVRVHLHDNAEGTLDRPRELRIVLTDKPVPPESINGLVFLPIEQLAMRGEVHGLILKLDPANPNEVVVTVLDKPEEAGMSLMTQSLSTSGRELWKKFAFAAGQASGEMVDEASDEEATHALTYQFKFSAPVENEPAVTADLKGKAAQASPQVAVIRAKAKAMAAGDLGGMKKATSAAANLANEQRMAQMGLGDDALQTMLKQYGPEMVKAAGTIQRVVVRGDHAVGLAKGDGGAQWFNFVLEGGEWKSND